MDERAFDEVVENQMKRRIQRLDDYVQPTETFQLTPMQAAYMQRMLNSTKSEQNKGYLLLPIRRQTQTLFKLAVAEEEAKTFGDQQQMILLLFYKSLDSVKNKISQNEFHCFLTLQQLRRHPLCRYFMALPDPLYLKLYDFNDIIGQPLDIRLIANKLLRRKYQNRDDFEVDMVTMIQNYRIYFINDQEMFDISIKFELLFWDIYTNEESSNKEAMDTFNYFKQRCKIARKVRNKGQKVAMEKRKKLVNYFNSLTPDIKKKIVFLLESGPMKNSKMTSRGEVDVRNMNDQFFMELEVLLKQNQQQQKRVKQSAKKHKELRQKKPRQPKQPKQKKLGSKIQDKRFDDNSIYYSSEQEGSEGNQQNKQEAEVSRKAVQQVMDLINMEEAVFGSDDD